MTLLSSSWSHRSDIGRENDKSVLNDVEWSNDMKVSHTMQPGIRANHEQNSSRLKKSQAEIWLRWDTRPALEQKTEDTYDYVFYLITGGLSESPCWLGKCHQKYSSIDQTEESCSNVIMTWPSHMSCWNDWFTVYCQNSRDSLGGEELSVYCQFWDDTNLTLARQPLSRVGSSLIALY